MNKLYKYYVEASKEKISINCDEYEIIAETEKDIVYKFRDRLRVYEIMDYLGNKNEECRCIFNIAKEYPTFKNVPCIQLFYYTKNKTKNDKKKIFNAIKKCVENNQINIDFKQLECALDKED